MMIALERLCEYKKDPNHSMEEHIGVMYDKLWNFQMIFSKPYELSMEQEITTRNSQFTYGKFCR